MKRLLIPLALAAIAVAAPAQQKREKTTFQTSGKWKPVTDIRADVVMVYGTDDRPGLTFRQRVQ